MSSLIFPLSAAGAVVMSRERVTSSIIDEATSGKESRASWWASPKTRYQIGFNVLSATAPTPELQKVESFFARHAGQLDSFLITDPEDNAVTDHGFGVGNGSTLAFQLQRSMLGKVYDTLGGPWTVSSKPRTNLCIRSQEFDNAAWTKTSATVTANSATVLAPDGTATADKLVEAAATAAHAIASTAFTTTNGATYTHTVFARASGETQFSIWDSVSSGNAVFNLSTGSVVSANFGASATITACPASGWYRCSMTFTASGVTGGVKVFLRDGASFLGDGTSGVYLWGAQAVASSAPTQYIATTTAAVTVNPSYWPSYSDGFESVADLVPGPTILKDGVALTLGTDYALSTTGLVTFAVAPALAAVLSWSGSYYRRVRFEEANLSYERIVYRLWKSTLSLISVKDAASSGVAVTTAVAAPLQPYTDSTFAGTVTGTINGTTGSDGNAVFTLSRVPVLTLPIAGYRDGNRLTKGTDFTVSGATVTMLATNIPITGDSLVFDYYA